MLSAKIRRFPPEITDYMIDHLHSDFATLASCSLVCKAWLPVARYHLFSAISLHPWKKDKFLRLVESPVVTFAACVRRVYMREGRGAYTWEKKWLNEALPRMKALIGVETLEVERITWEFLGAAARQNFLSIFGSITELRLHHFQFRSFHDLMQFVDAFPLLEVLYFDEVKWEKEFMEFDLSPQYQPPSNLRVLSLLHGRKDTVLNWIRSGRRKPLLHMVQLEAVSEEEIPVAHIFLSAIKLSLKNLTITFADDFYCGDSLKLVRELDLSCVTQLQKFRLCISPIVPSMDWVLKLFGQLHAPHINEVSIDLLYRAPSQMERIDWEGLVDIFSEPRFASLQSLNVKTHNKDGRDGMEHIRRHFDKFRDRRILWVGMDGDEA